MRPKCKRVYCNDDGWIIGACDGPLTPQAMWEQMIAPYLDTPVDTFLWSVGGHEVYDYETQIGERFGQQKLQAPEDICKAENLGRLMDEHGGPLTVIAGLCRRAGLRFLPSMRMNEHYDMEESAPNYGRLRREHPEFLIGRGDKDLPPGSLEWGIRTGLDYTLPEVRSHMLGIATELVQDFDIDGLELDFMRHPAFFRREEAYAHAYLMTDLVAGVRRVLQASGKDRELVVRVPPTLADCRRIGLDVVSWMQQGLVDTVIGGGGFIPFSTPLDEFVEAARPAGCRVLGCFEALRPFLDEEAMRAAAARYWTAGADGLYLFNYYSMPNDWRRRVLGLLSDPAAVAVADKRYELDRSPRPETRTQLWLSFRNAIPLVQLPLTLWDTPEGGGAALEIEVADDIEGALAEGRLKKVVLGLGFETLVAADALQVQLNGLPLAWGDRQVPTKPWVRCDYGPDWNRYPSRLAATALAVDAVEWAVDAAVLRQGANRLELRLAAGGRPLVLEEVRLSLQYGLDQG
jgi:hypothetical protein